MKWKELPPVAPRGFLESTVVAFEETFTVGKQLGGGFGAVYLATRKRTGERVAVKMLESDAAQRLTTCAPRFR